MLFCCNLVACSSVTSRITWDRLENCLNDVKSQHNVVSVNGSRGSLLSPDAGRRDVSLPRPRQAVHHALTTLKDTSIMRNQNKIYSLTQINIRPHTNIFLRNCFIPADHNRFSRKSHAWHYKNEVAYNKKFHKGNA